MTVFNPELPHLENGDVDWLQVHANEKELRRRLAEAQNWKCCYCTGEMSPSWIGRKGKLHKASTEHLVERRYKGPTSFDNCVSACRSCNSVRPEISPEKYYEVRQALLPVWPPCTQIPAKIATRFRDDYGYYQRPVDIAGDLEYK